MRRKAQELILAVWLETKFTKKQILALYLNRVNFGGGAYGIEAASQRYFNKPAAQLTLGEAALLAATMKGPSRYNPAANADRAAKRATMVLDAMVETGAITAGAARRGVRAAGAGLGHAGQPARAVFHRLARRPGARPARQGADRGPGGRDHARPADPGRRRAGGARRRRRATRTRACSRARWWRWTARAASAPTSAAPTTPTASSTAPPRPSARPARRSSRSST